MSIEILEAKAELKDLVDTFSNLADVKDAAAQGELFLPDGALEFQMGMDGAINKIEGREALVQAFAATINPCKAVYHINGQHTVTVNGDSAEGIAYCVATLVNDVDGKDIVTSNYVRYRAVRHGAGKLVPVGRARQHTDAVQRQHNCLHCRRARQILRAGHHSLALTGGQYLHPRLVQRAAHH